MSVVFGEVPEFKCDVSGDPLPTIEWRLDGVILNVSANTDIVITYTPDGNKASGTLKYNITDKSLGNDHVITCRAMNLKGHKDSNTSFVIEGRRLLYCMTLISGISQISVSAGKTIRFALS